MFGAQLGSYKFQLCTLIKVLLKETITNLYNKMYRFEEFSLFVSYKLATTLSVFLKKKKAAQFT